MAAGWLLAPARRGLQAARERGRVGGRPTAMTDERRQVAQRMLDDGYRPTQVATSALAVCEAVALSVPAAGTGNEPDQLRARRRGCGESNA